MPIDYELFKINLMISNYENLFTRTIIFGGLKIPFGFFQTTVAMSVFVFIKFNELIFGKFSKDEDFSKIKKFSKLHIKHGMGNIVSGIVEFTPIGTCVIFFIRNRKWHEISDKDKLTNTEINYHKVGFDKWNDREEDWANDNSDGLNSIRGINSYLLDPRTKLMPYFTIDELRNFVKSMPIKRV